MIDRIAEHYERVAATYDEHWAYNPDYVRRFARAMVDELRLIPSDTIADVGCGTGLYSRRLAEEVRPERPILCVDPVAAMLDRLPTSRGLQPVLARAEELASGRVPLPDDHALDAVVVKESVHHLSDPGDTLAGLAGLLSGHGRILVVMLPTTIEHPLFQAAHRRFQELQPDPTTIEDIMAAAGLRASVSYRTFHVVIERERYIRMLESRYMSVLGEFSDDELAAGIEQFRHAYRDPVLRFDDHYAFVKGWMPHRSRRGSARPRLAVVTDEEPTSEAEIARRIDENAAEEHRIRSGSHGTMSDADRARLHDLEVERDRLYDLKRQRQGRRDAGDDPAGAHERAAGVVEDYRQ